MIQITNMTGGYGEKPIVDDVSFTIDSGEFFGVVGPNGSGKTTLFKLMSRIIPLWKGNVFIEQKPLQYYTRKQLARKVATLPQIQQSFFSYNVYETVMMGRYAYQTGFFKQPTELDKDVVKRVLEQTGLTKMRTNPLDHLSGGERQRVYLAQALAQEPDILLLDEPTNHLDFSYQKQLLDDLKQLSLTNRLTVVSIFHDLNIASLYCDRLLLMDQGQITQIGKPEEVMKKALLERVYHSSIDVHANPTLSSPQMNLLPDYSLEKTSSILSPELLEVTEEKVVIKTTQLLKTFSSALVGGGFGWYRNFINYHVDKNFNCHSPRQLMLEKCQQWGMAEHDTVAMMTAAHLPDYAVRFSVEENVRILIVVTAGTGNAVDVVHGGNRMLNNQPGTVNTWIFIEGHLSEQAFIQGIVTATEAKTKAFSICGIKDPMTETLATGTSTDSVLIASTQKGENLEYAGPITFLGSRIGEMVYEATKEAIEHNIERMKHT
ncbi:adenosylcobinamide amidohydrolase [Virgibacillus necropolis]|uniref:ABC transporter ATP-binding protein n=1 Tax=Virgibacillus necropolis TaxID=163877 RepID=A0A221MAL9_9BACI|nr:adenosylcobinamide amidohydrolase [Virgibacillus necropolis]ASN04683.1 ABC transporter ATP-binding protein [Virgibacillus necropolis]